MRNVPRELGNTKPPVPISRSKLTRDLHWLRRLTIPSRACPDASRRPRRQASAPGRSKSRKPDRSAGRLDAFRYRVHVAWSCRYVLETVGKQREQIATRATQERPAPMRGARRFCLRCNALNLAGELGFEPRFSESESDVLPLNYSPTDRARVGGIRMALTWGNLANLTSP